MKFTPMKHQRLKSSLSQKAVAKMLGISQPYLSQIESYDVPTPQEFISKLTKLYKCTPQELFPS